MKQVTQDKIWRIINLVPEDKKLEVIDLIYEVITETSRETEEAVKEVFND